MDPFETKLRLAPHLVLATARDDSTYLLEAGRQYRVQEPLHAALLAGADGTRTGEALMRDLDERFGGAEVLYALGRLQQRGFLVPSDSELGAERAAFWAPEGLERGGIERLERTRVRCDVVGSVDAAQVEEALSGAGIQIGPGPGQPALALVVGSDYHDPGWLAQLARCRAEGIAALPARITGQSAWLGPFIGGGAEAPCERCLSDSLARNRPISTYLAQSGHTALEPVLGSLPTSLTAAAGFVALRLADAIVKGDLAALGQRLLALDLRRFTLAEHALRKRPQCPVCGEPEWMARQLERPIVLHERALSHGDDGGYRSVSPEETYQRYRHLVTPLTGVLSSLGELTDRSHPLSPIYAAGYFVSPVAADAAETFDRTSLGKGRSHAQSRASALCEGLERYAAVWQGDEPRRRASYAELAPLAVDPRSIQNFSDAQYRTRNEDADRRRMVPLPFDPHQVIDWSPAWELTRARRRWLPTGYCFTHAPVSSEERVALYNPNGHAAGNCLEEAILQGFLELVERDASALWWYNRAPRPALDLDSFDSDFFRQLGELDRSRGLTTHVLDLTHDLEIPVMVAIALEERTGRYFMGFGCHLDAGLAVQRSLTELHQVFDPTGKGEAPFKRADFDDERFLFPSSKQLVHASALAPPPQGKDLAAAVTLCVDRVARLGMDTLVIDYTRPDVGLSTVKVVVPGLRHFWPRLGPGRLYDVPRALGWIERPLTEAELNPVPLLM